MYRKSLYLVSLLTLFVFIAGCAGISPQRSPEPEQQAEEQTYTTLFEEAADDPHEEGCVSCHKKTADVDRSLPVYVKRIQGHPSVKDTSVNGCYACHEAEKNYKLWQDFTRGMHKSHWQSETFYARTNGKCFSCHSVEKNGVSGIKDYPLAGYRTGLGAAPAKEKAKPVPAPKQQEAPRQQQAPQQQPPAERRQEAPAPERQPEENRVEEQPTPGP